jgi:hypothetical protein
MEIWDERVRLQDARDRVRRLAEAFEPVALPKREPRPHAHRHPPFPMPHPHLRIHLVH